MFLSNIFVKKKKRYISCPWIEYGIDFDLGVYGSNLKTCCYMSAPGGGNLILVNDYRGEKIDWKNFFKLRNSYRKLQERGKTIPQCEGCIFLHEAEWEQKNEITHIIFDHWTHCNCKCTYCYTEEDKNSYNNLATYNVLPIVKDMLDKNILKPGGAIGFGGGEPTMLEEFEELIGLLLKNNFTNIRVPSSGIKYSPIIEQGIALNKLTVVISIDSATKDTYKKIKQIDAFDKVCENIIKYANAQTTVGTVVSKYIIIPGTNDTISELDKWLTFNKENNILSIAIDVENSWLGRLKEHEEEYKNIIKLIKHVKKSASEMNFIMCDVCDRAKHLIKSHKNREKA